MNKSQLMRSYQSKPVTHLERERSLPIVEKKRNTTWIKKKRGGKKPCLMYKQPKAYQFFWVCHHRPNLHLQLCENPNQIHRPHSEYLYYHQPHLPSSPSVIYLATKSAPRKLRVISLALKLYKAHMKRLKILEGKGTEGWVNLSLVLRPKSGNENTLKTQKMSSAFMASLGKKANFF